MLLPRKQSVSSVVLDSPQPSPVSPRLRDSTTTQPSQASHRSAPMIEVPALSEGLIRALVGVAENPEDSLRAVCLESLAELGEILPLLVCPHFQVADCSSCTC